MTTLVAWLGVDSRGPSSIYLASDSRISWGAGPNMAVWDEGRKVFASAHYPEILGYVGDVLFPSQVLGQVVALIDSNILFSPEDSAPAKWSKIESTLQSSLRGYPSQQALPFQILYCTRELSGMASVFHMFESVWHADEGMTACRKLEMPRQSDVIEVYGSGKTSMKRWHGDWQRVVGESVSRSVFGAFCDVLMSEEDPYTGGAPQLVGIYRKGPARPFGIAYRRQRYFMGAPVQQSDILAGIEWRGDVLERTDAQTMGRLEGAQPQPRPRELRRLSSSRDQ